MVRVCVGGVAILPGVVVQCCHSLQQSLQNSSQGHSLSTGDNHYYVEPIATFISWTGHFFNTHGSESPLG